MFSDDTIAGSWPVLAARLDRRATISRWAAAEPALGAATVVTALPALLRPGADRAGVDRMLAGLVRLAAADGGDDEDAVLVLLHLLSDGALALAARLVDVAPDMLRLVVGELTAQIRAFPWRRRTRASRAAKISGRTSAQSVVPANRYG